MAIEYFCCYHSYRRSCEKLTDQELGRLFRALLDYSETGISPDLTGRESIAFDFIACDIDRAKEAYEKRCASNAENGKKGGRPKTEKTEGFLEKPNGFFENPTKPKKAKEKEKEKEKKKEKENVKESIGAAGDQPPTLPRHKYGEYGWVKLTDDEYNRLLDDLGETELLRCIKYVDESAQGNHNKNKWSDWNLVVRKCHRDGWGLKQKSKHDAGSYLESQKQRDGADWMLKYRKGGE